ncbi:hypothetical protein VTN02DRAFT_1971 [Thermoascus thermophilus]
MAQEERLRVPGRGSWSVHSDSEHSTPDKDQSDSSAVLRLLTKQTELLVAQMRELELLRAMIQHPLPHQQQYQQPSSRRPSAVSALHVQQQQQQAPITKEEEQRRVWQNEILSYHNDDLLRSYYWRKGLSIEQLLSPTRPWNTWSYRAAYPKLSAFLAKASLTEASRSQVLCEDFTDDGRVSRWESTEGVLNHASLWDAIGTRLDDRQDGTASSYNGSALSRILRIVDLSPIVASIVLGSTPRVNLSKIAPFLERYLSFTNYGRASLFGIGSTSPNAYLFEYHFAFYFVPQTYMDKDLAVKDFRGLRRSAAFGPGLAQRSRYIYEEQLSFILVGFGDEVYTCYQLAEKYFVGPYITGAGKSTLFINPDQRRLDSWTPSAIFLSWIMVTMHHVQLRWQIAIDAVDAQIDSPSQIIFSEENPDLLSDDPQFSRSKTYFWALQAYKMFDDALSATINTWYEFRQNSLPCLNDGRMSAEDWESSTRSIDAAIDKLNEKLLWVRKKSSEVRDLRDGLFGASSLFDSRTTVRQGDNIRLLTYITLLFLPLSFCTSIFGMQTLIPRTLPMSAFAIALPSITVVTILLVFNLQTIIDAWEKFSSDITYSLRELMKNHNRQDWRETADALYADRLARQPPVKKAQRKSSHWVYALFLLEAVTVSFPVSEIENAYRRIRFLFSNAAPDPYLLQETAGVKPKDSEQAALSRAQRVKYARERELRKQRKVRYFNPLRFSIRVVVKMSRVALATTRTLLLIFWIPLVTLEYILLLSWFMISPPKSLFVDKGRERPSRHSTKDQTEGSSPPEKPAKSLWSLSSNDLKSHTVSIFILPFRWLGFAFAQPEKPPPPPEPAPLKSKRIRTKFPKLTRHIRELGSLKMAATHHHTHHARPVPVPVEGDKVSAAETLHPPSQSQSQSHLQVPSPSLASTAFDMEPKKTWDSTVSAKRWYKAQRHQASGLNEDLTRTVTMENQGPAVLVTPSES